VVDRILLCRGVLLEEGAECTCSEICGAKCARPLDEEPYSEDGFNMVDVRRMTGLDRGRSELLTIFNVRDEKETSSSRRWTSKRHWPT
jgi:hypothetical protein